MTPVSSDEAARPGRLPLAMAAVTVAGQCRERSPADVAIFGAEATRFAERFAMPQRGGALLAEALAAGVAETEAELRTGTGSAPFRVALWRQRGGERIRLLASFAQNAVPRADGGSEAAPGAVERFAMAIRPALLAVTDMAERMASASDGGGARPLAAEADDLLTAAWRMNRLVDDLELLAVLGTEGPLLRMTEVDLQRLAGRVVRLAQPRAVASGISLTLLEGDERIPGVLADETTVWTLLDGLIGAALAQTGRGGRLSLGCRPDRGGLELSLRRDGHGPAASGPAAPLAALAAANGARLDAEGGVLARLVFPRRRCLGPL